MSISRARYVGGDTKKAAFKPNPLFPFQKGDLLFVDPNDKMLRPASAIFPGGAITVAQYQGEFAQYFVGVADEKYGLQPATAAPAGQTTPVYDGEKTFNVALAGTQRSIAVCTAGRFEFDCPATTWNNGDKVGIYAVLGMTGIPDSQTVLPCATNDTTAAGLSQSIGIVYQQEAPIEQAQATQTRIVVDIQPAQPMGTIRTAGSYGGITSGQ